MPEAPGLNGPIAVIGNGPSFDRLDLQEFEGWGIVAVNAAITALPAEMAQRAIWAVDLPAALDCKALVQRLPPPPWRAIVRAGDLLPWHRRLCSKLWEVPSPTCSLARALMLLSQWRCSPVVLAAVDMRKRAVPGLQSHLWPYYWPPFDWKPRVPDRLKKYRRQIITLAERGRIGPGVYLHPTSEWDKDPYFPRWRGDAHDREIQEGRAGLDNDPGPDPRATAGPGLGSSAQ